VQIASETRSRTTLVIALTLAAVLLGVVVVSIYRHDHRDEYQDYAIPWEYFETSADGRTLTFRGALGSSSCADPVGVELQIERDPVVATAIYRRPSVLDGKAVFCTADLGVRPPVVAQLDEPLPPSALVVDGYEPSEWHDRGVRCNAAEQRVGDPVPQHPSGPEFAC
jgi:hypothetical protein